MKNFEPWNHVKTRSNHQRCSMKKRGLQLFYKETLAQVFSSEFCEISKNTFFTEHLRWLLLFFGDIKLYSLSIWQSVAERFSCCSRYRQFFWDIAWCWCVLVVCCYCCWELTSRGKCFCWLVLFSKLVSIFPNTRHKIEYSSLSFHQTFY